MTRKHKILDSVPARLKGREINEDANIADAIKTMKETNYSCLLVKNHEGKSSGILSEHDIVNAFANLGDQAKQSQVTNHMALDIICISQEQTLDDAIKLMAQNNVRHVPVISESGHVVSFVSVMELLMAKIAV